jgi:hypothetical protein
MGRSRNKKHIQNQADKNVASTGIEPVSGASGTLILSIVLRGQYIKHTFLCIWRFAPTVLLGLYYPLLRGWEIRDHFTLCINPGALTANIFTAMASKITPKNLRTAINPAGPNSLAIGPNDFKTI